MKRFGVNWETVPSLSQLSDGDLRVVHKRNHFHNYPTNTWLRSRYGDKVKPQYLYYPEERQLQMELKQIFKVFDENDSKTLDLAEIFMMFKHFGFEVSKNDLEVIYSYIDSDQDKALNYDEFKAFTEHPQALKSFRQMMDKMQKQMIIKQSKVNPNYVPLSVGAMLTYLSYMLSRERFLEKISNEQLPITEKYEAFQNLIIVKEKKTIVDDAYEMYLKAQAKFVEENQQIHSLKAIYQNQNSMNESVKLRMGFRKSFSCANGLQPLLFRNMSMRDAEQITELASLMKIKSSVFSPKSISQILSESSSDEEDQVTNEEEMEKLIKEAQIQGQQEAQIQLDSQMRNEFSLQPEIPVKFPNLRLRTLPQKAVTNKSMLQRSLKITNSEEPLMPPLKQSKIIKHPKTKYHHMSSITSERSHNHMSTLASHEITINSRDEQLSVTNRILSMRLPYVK